MHMHKHVTVTRGYQGKLTRRFDPDFGIEAGRPSRISSAPPTTRSVRPLPRLRPTLASNGPVSPCVPFYLAANMPKVENQQVENVNEADFMTLGRWLMGNTKDMEVRSTPRLPCHTPAG